MILTWRNLDYLCWENLDNSKSLFCTKRKFKYYLNYGSLLEIFLLRESSKGLKVTVHVANFNH